MNSKNMLKDSKGFTRSGSAGFTLIELLLVVALLAISFGITSDILLTLMRSFNKTTVINEVEQEANFSAQKLEKEIRNAANLEVPVNTRVRFQNTNGQIFVYEVLNNVLYRYPNGSSPSLTYAITGHSGIPITGLIGGVAVTCGGSGCFTLNNGTPQVLRVDLVFAQAQANPNSSYTGRVGIVNTIVARNTY